MHEAMGQFGLHYKDQAQGTLGSLVASFPTKQSDRLSGIGHRDTVHRGSSTVGCR